MAALRPCASPLVVVGVQPLVSSSPSASSFHPVLGKWGRSNSFVKHRLSAAQHLRRHSLATSAHKDGVYWPFGLYPDDDNYKPMTNGQINNFHEGLKEDWQLDVDMPFRDEMETIDDLWKKMTSWNTSIFHMDATALSLLLCILAKGGVKLASRIIDSATLRLEKRDEISVCTIKQTLAMYVSIFVKVAEDTYNKRFNQKSLFSLLGAFRGVAAIAQILLKDSLESVNYAQNSSSNYRLLVQETNDMWHEFEENMKTLEYRFKAALFNEDSKAYYLLRPTMEKPMKLAIFFVSTMVASHKRVLLGHTRALDDSATSLSYGGQTETDVGEGMK